MQICWAAMSWYYVKYFLIRMFRGYHGQKDVDNLFR